ncbi:hypothetical protein IJT93_12325 [bacterium]|nr:hypothetical protein [bacterium]
MNKKFFASALILAGLLCAADQAQANEVNLGPQKLKAYGIDVKKAHIDRISHDGSFIIMHQKNTPEKLKDGLGHVCFAIHINPYNNEVQSVRSYEVPASSWEYVIDTKDEKDLIIVTKGGATFLKLNFESGEVSTLHEHVAGESGFRGFPPIMRMVDGEIFIGGYFHNEEDLSDVDCTATLDPTKTGVDAFDRVWDYQGMVVKLDPQALAFTKTDMAFFAKDNLAGDAKMYLWNPPEIEKPMEFDSGKSVICMWGAKDRVIYSIQRKDGTYDLMVYDGKAKEKFFVDKGSKDMYANVFMSADGNTVLFTDTGNRIKRASYFYADADHGWKLTPVYDFHGKTRLFGEIRISDDGSKFIIKNPQGLTIADVKE